MTPDEFDRFCKWYAQGRLRIGAFWLAIALLVFAVGVFVLHGIASGDDYWSARQWVKDDAWDAGGYWDHYDKVIVSGDWDFGIFVPYLELTALVLILPTLNSCLLGIRHGVTHLSELPNRRERARQHRIQDCTAESKRLDQEVAALDRHVKELLGDDKTLP